MKLAMSLATAALMFVSTAAAQDAKPVDTTKIREQALKTVKKGLGVRSEGLFVLALGEATVPQAGGNGEGGGKGEGGAAKGGEGQRAKGGRPGAQAQPQVSWEFQVVEGRDAAANTVVNHMSAGTQTSLRNWRLVQRFNTSEKEKADAAVTQLQEQAQQQTQSREGEGKKKGAEK
jgi:hypothetical protein